MSILIASVIKTSQVALQTFFPPPLPASSMQQQGPTFLLYLTSLTMIVSAREVQVPQLAPPPLPPPRLPPPYSIFLTMTAFAKEAQALHILPAHLIDLLPSQVGALPCKSQARSAALARASAQPLVAAQE